MPSTHDTLALPACALGPRQFMDKRCSGSTMPPDSGAAPAVPAGAAAAAPSESKLNRLDSTDMAGAWVGARKLPQRARAAIGSATVTSVRTDSAPKLGARLAVGDCGGEGMRAACGSSNRAGPLMLPACENLRPLAALRNVGVPTPGHGAP